MNLFDEHTWSADQRRIDLLIAIEFEALEGTRAAHDESGLPVEAWLDAAGEQASMIRALVGQLEHAGRRKHWAAEMQRVGLAIAPVTKPEPVAPEAAPEPVEPPRRRGGPPVHA